MTSSIWGFSDCVGYATRRREQKENELKTYKHIMTAGLVATMYSGFQMISDSSSESRQMWATCLVASICTSFFTGLKALRLYGEVKALVWTDKTSTQKIQSLLDLEQQDGFIDAGERASRAIRLLERVAVDDEIIRRANLADQRSRASLLAQSIS